MFARFAQIAVVALALATGNQANAAPLAYGTYYDETINQNCSPSSLCRVNFSQLPADKLLMVQKINCVVVSVLPIVQAVFQISATSGGTNLQRQLPLAVPPSQLIGSIYYTSFREDTHFLVGNGRFPFIAMTASNTTTSWGVTCTLIGDLVTPIS
jgi:hypothetical protein